ncbi:hypothetical protein [Pseudomonas syringae]|uniref:hypothetical protein n=1 Tax=Pseudomonas syringae TaxID=317 RepID=UPI0007EE5CC9|nr:hypothetical protein [Pseudomonas syringae]MCH5519026.1 hypothetical protein [Pseudomonas syringae pv. lapsa]OBS35862.1 hypothetical protein A9K81_05575 [Pseudomonas syringae pv. syringae]
MVDHEARAKTEELNDRVTALEALLIRQARSAIDALEERESGLKVLQPLDMNGITGLTARPAAMPSKGDKYAV